jgi:hypothetical protein
MLKSKCVCGGQRRRLRRARRLLHRAVAPRRARGTARRRRLARSRHRLLGQMRGLLRSIRVAVLAGGSTLRRVRRILGMMAIVYSGVMPWRWLRRSLMHGHLARTRGRVRIAHRRRVRIVHRLARSGHKLRLARVDSRAVGRVLGICSIRRGGGVVRVRRWVCLVRVGVCRRMRRVNSLTGHVVVNGALDSARYGRSSGSRVGRPSGLGRQMNAITGATGEARRGK